MLVSWQRCSPMLIYSVPSIVISPRSVITSDSLGSRVTLDDYFTPWDIRVAVLALAGARRATLWTRREIPGSSVCPPAHVSAVTFQHSNFDCMSEVLNTLYHSLRNLSIRVERRLSTREFLATTNIEL